MEKFSNLFEDLFMIEVSACKIIINVLMIDKITKNIFRYENIVSNNYIIEFF